MLYQLSYPSIKYPNRIELISGDLQSPVLTIGLRVLTTPCEGFEPPYPCGMPDFKSGAVPIEPTRHKNKELPQ